MAFVAYVLQNVPSTFAAYVLQNVQSPKNMFWAFPFGIDKAIIKKMR